jgi:hypothetical protein
VTKSSNKQPLDHDDDDEYHPNRNAMKIANIIYNEHDDEFHF